MKKFSVREVETLKTTAALYVGSGCPSPTPTPRPVCHTLPCMSTP
jgi:hypothetical protein